METAIIIRTKNEEKWIGAVLEKLKSQTYQNFEIIIVDSGSTDKTLEIARQHPVTVVEISQEKFSYPYALNVGCRQAKAEKYFVLLSAHSLPISDTWLTDGLENFKDGVLGVYGGVVALPDGSFWEKMFFNKMLVSFAAIFFRKRMVHKPGLGVLGFTNAIVRKDLWRQYYFNEAYGSGGEDTAWAAHWMKKGYVAIRDLRFTVQHSHGLGLRAFIAQYQYWTATKKPKPFEKLTYRNWKW